MKYSGERYRAIVALFLYDTKLRALGLTVCDVYKDMVENGPN